MQLIGVSVTINPSHPGLFLLLKGSRPPFLKGCQAHTVKRPPTTRIKMDVAFVVLQFCCAKFGRVAAEIVLEQI